MSSQGMLTPSDLRPIQRAMGKHLMAHPQAALWADMGSGKTAVTLSVLAKRMDQLEVYGTLILGPLRVIQTVWDEEATKWSHLKDRFRFSLVHGTPDERHRALRVPADIYLCNYEGLDWLAEEVIRVYLSKGRYPPFNALVLDEISKMKDSGSVRHKALCKLLPYLPTRIGLTGTPAGNGYLDLHGQYLALDSGRRLGVCKKEFKDKFFQKGYMAYEIEVKAGGKEAIHEAIADITMEYAPKRKPEELPVYTDLWVRMSPKVQAAYDKLEKVFFMEMDSGSEIEVFNSAALSMKIRQAASGSLYIEPENPNWEVLHDEKLNALSEVIEEAAGSPVMVIYQFRHEMERVQKKYPGAVAFSSKLSAVETKQLIKDWQAGKISMLLGHAESIGLGVDGLQHGGHIQVWYGLTWSLTGYLQTVARLDRSGQKRRVSVVRILTADTIDEAMVERLIGKEEDQEGLKQAVNSYRKRRGL